MGKKISLAGKRTLFVHVTGGNHAKELRWRRMSLATFIGVWKDRIKVIEQTAIESRARSRAEKIRKQFDATPSRRVIKERSEPSDPNPVVVEAYYSQLFSPKQGDRLHSPTINDSISRLREHHSSVEPVEVEERVISGMVKTVLKSTTPWKAPGEGGIPAGAYKLLPNAFEYHVVFVMGALTGKRPLSSEREVMSSAHFMTYSETKSTLKRRGWTPEKEGTSIMYRRGMTSKKHTTPFIISC